MANTQGDPVGGDKINVGDIEGVGIAIGTGASVEIHGDVYYPIKLRAPLRELFDPLLDDHTALFAGRDAVLARIGEFIQDPAGGYLVITAPAGFGKTALMANLVSRTPQTFAYHFFTSTYVTDGLSEDFFLRNVVEQMAEWHGHKRMLPSTLHELGALYHKFLDEPLERTQVLVLDGLDEVRPWKLSRYLSRRAPPNLHIILTVRDVGQDWAREYELAVDQIKHLPLGGLNRDEVAQVLRVAGQDAVVFAEDPPLLNEVMRISAYQADEALGADPFYVRLLAEDVAEGRLTPDNVADQPQGLDAYLDTWWQEVKELAGDQPAGDLFGTLAVALGPICHADLEAVNPSLVDEWAEDFFDDILRKVRRWVIGDAARGYSIAHPRLRHYMNRRMKTDPYQGKLLAFCRNWQDHLGPYALTYYVDHLADAGLTKELYTTILDPAFREAQRTVLGDTSKTLDDLRLAMKLALENDAVVTVLSCVAAYRYTTRTTSIAQAILDAVDDKDFEKALKLAALKGAVPDWGRVLHLYLLWEAALAKDTKVNYKDIVAAADNLSLVQAQELCDALLVLIARTLARGDTAKTKANLVDFNRGQDADELLESYTLAQPLCEAEADSLRGKLEPRLQLLEQQTAGGDAQVTRDVLHDTLRLEEMAEKTPEHTQNLRHQLLRLAAHRYGRESLERILDVVLFNPYPRYRDMGLVECGLICVAASEDGWARQTLREIIYAGLDREGMTFTFDLPFMLLEEAQRRGFLESQLGSLPEYRQKALDHRDPWGTSLRALNACAATLFRQGELKKALGVLREAPKERAGFAGYAALHYLALANRWHEFGQPVSASGPIQIAQENADKVRAKDFRHDRLQLVETYCTWRKEKTVAVETGLATLFRILDVDTRLAYIDHLSARWAWPAAAPNWGGLKKLVPLALVDGTILDAVLARLCGLYLASSEYKLSDDDLAEAIRICDSPEMMSRPWEEEGQGRSSTRLSKAPSP